MNKILTIILFTFIISFSNASFYPPDAKADTAANLRACNMAVDRLNTLGFNYPRFPQNTKPIDFGAVTCGVIEGTYDDIIQIETNPLRVTVYSGARQSGYCLNWTTNNLRKIKKSSDC
jgi:hypothetical protein